MTNDFLTFASGFDHLKKAKILEVPDEIVIETTPGTYDQVVVKGKKISIQYQHPGFVFFSVFSFVNGIEIGDIYKFRDFGLMIDCSRNSVLSKEGVKAIIRLASVLGYSSLQLYTEDTYEIKNQPYFGRMRGRYTEEELKELDAYGMTLGVELIPCIECLAHLERIFTNFCYKGLQDCNGILLAGEDATYSLIEDMISSARNCFSSKRINVGLDEAFGLGRGSYLDKNGYETSSEILLKHVDKVLAITKKYGFKPMMWGDMFFRLGYGEYFAFGKDIKNKIKAPDGMEIIYWDYYHDKETEYSELLKKAKLFSDNVGFAGGCWTWNGFAPFNKRSIQITESALNACVSEATKDIFLTLWGDNGGECSPFLALPSLIFASSRIYGYGKRDIDIINHALSGVEMEDFMLIDALNESYEKKTSPVDNPSKYLLYNDLLNGLFDATLPCNGEEFYKELGNKLINITGNDFYSPFFHTYAKLALAIAAKVNLGKKIRRDYLEDNRVSLKDDLILIDSAITALNDFYLSYRSLYLSKNKPFGFDVTNIRMGGTLERMKECKRMVESYLSMEIDCIPQFDETPLPPFVNESDENTSYSINDFISTVTANSL